MSEALDDRLIVGGNRLALRVLAWRAVGIQFDQPDGEELHQLARVVFIRADVARGIGFLVAEHREIHTHRRVQRHVLHQLPEIPESVAGEQVVVVGERVGTVVQRALLGDDHDL